MISSSVGSRAIEFVGRFAPIALVAAFSIAVAGCQTTSPAETTGSLAMASVPQAEAD